VSNTQEGDYPSVVKRRYIWQISALRLLRERACAEWARQVVPPVVDGVSIEFPQTEVSLGLRVTVRSHYLDGRKLLSMLYERDLRERALELGLIALEALHGANVTSAPYSTLNRVYRLARRMRAALSPLLDPTFLSSSQKKEWIRLLARHPVPGKGKKVLVHGDLHPSHLIVNPSAGWLGFIDLEAMHAGRPATDFASLWGGFHYADPLFGLEFHRRYVARFSDLLDDRFDSDVRRELALRSHSHINVGMRTGNRDLEAKARRLLGAVLSGASFEQLVSSRGWYESPTSVP
jgi:aminoglycoside phosphotransferase (APT) family kinase protein